MAGEFPVIRSSKVTGIDGGLFQRWSFQLPPKAAVTSRWVSPAHFRSQGLHFAWTFEAQRDTITLRELSEGGRIARLLSWLPKPDGATLQVHASFSNETKSAGSRI